MKKTDAETRARVLATAQRLFGERGFKAVTVRDICSAAKANVAAVNYHFGDKLGLYREVLQVAIDAMRETIEAAREAGHGRTPDEKLRVFVHVFMHRAIAGGHAVHRLITREMTNPTPALDALVEQGLRPRIEYLSGVIAELIVCDVRDPRVLRCVASVQSQVIAHFPNPIAARLGIRQALTPTQIDAAARHIAVFSIAGVRAVGASQAESGARGRAPRSRTGAA